LLPLAALVNSALRLAAPVPLPEPFESLVYSSVALFVSSICLVVLIFSGVVGYLIYRMQVMFFYVDRDVAMLVSLIIAAMLWLALLIAFNNSIPVH